MSKPKQAGFTIVELLVVIVVIGILAAITIVAYNGINYRAKVTQVNSELGQIKSAMLMYKVEHGELPPLGDMSTIDWETNVVDLSDWKETLQSMVDDDIISQGDADNLLYDPWGNPYAYDDNDCNAVYSGDYLHEETYLRSVGPDHKAYYDDEGHTDDIEVLVTSGCE